MRFLSFFLAIFFGFSAVAATGSLLLLPASQALAGGGGSKPDKGHGEEGGSGSEVSFVKMAPLILPIIDESGVSQTVTLVVSLEVHESKIATEVRRMSPKLQDAFIQDMYGVLNKHAAVKGGVIQVAVIKERLTRVAKRIMGAEKVHDVLLQVVRQNGV